MDSNHDDSRNTHQRPPPASTTSATTPSLALASAHAPLTEPTSTEYFPPLPDYPQPVQPVQSLSSRPPISSSNSHHLVRERSNQGINFNLIRRPSIRIRRQINPAAAAAGNHQTQTITQDRRHPRSISQPERSQTLPSHVILARHSRHSRRVPPPPLSQIQMPRLTEEGSRPSLGELGLSNYGDNNNDTTSNGNGNGNNHDDNDSDDDGREVASPTRSLPDLGLQQERQRRGRGPVAKMSRLFWPRRHTQGALGNANQASVVDAGSVDSADGADDEYDAELVDYLDTIDPEVQTLSTLTNVQNSLFVPDLGPWLNRRPTYNLSQHQLEQAVPRPPTRAPSAPPVQFPELKLKPEQKFGIEPEPKEPPPTLQRSSTISSSLTDSHYAALPHGVSLEGWTADEKSELDDHVRHMLHSRRSKFKRSLKGFGQYVRRPLGFLVTLYATLITLFGLAWVLFLIGWIYVGERQVYVIHVIDSVLVALFAVMGDGLAPFRAIDTYHMIFVVYYARIVRNSGIPQRKKLKKRRVPPEVQLLGGNMADQGSAVLAAGDDDRNTNRWIRDLERQSTRSSSRSGRSIDPHTLRNNIVVDVQDSKSCLSAYQETPLTPSQQTKLHHHQKKLANSHSFYKPHETNTHYAFPLAYLIATVILLDCHSLLQISLGACTWGIDYHTRPFALTTVILCASITCNVTAGVVITVGDRKTRKKDVWQLMNRQELTGDAMRVIEKKRSVGSGKGGGSESDKDKDKKGQI